MNESVDTDEATTPLVSAIIPTYGRNERLSSAIQSVLEQTYDDIELFVVDDASPTPVRETLDSFDPTVENSFRILRHDENQGANAARNTGIRASDGRYVAFLDDDDQWDETKITKQVQAFQESDSETGVVYTGVRKDGPEGTTVSTPIASGDVMKDLLTGTNFGQFSSVMVDTTVIETAGLPDERLPAWQDREWFFRLAQHTHFRPVRETLTYRQTGLPDSITKKYEQKRDVAYPMLISKHDWVAAEYGIYYERMFKATMRRSLARSAVRADRYKEARKYFLLSALANPLYWPVYPHLFASLGGKWSYESIASLRQQVTNGPASGT